MTIEIRAKVGRFPKTNLHGYRAAPWRARVYVHDTEKPNAAVMYGLEQWRSSLPEALQAVQVMRRDLDRELMDKVHESRATRRAQRCGACRDLSNAHIYRGDCLATEPTA